MMPHELMETSNKVLADLRDPSAVDEEMIRSAAQSIELLQEALSQKSVLNASHVNEIIEELRQARIAIRVLEAKLELKSPDEDLVMAHVQNKYRIRGADTDLSQRSSLSVAEANAIINEASEARTRIRELESELKTWKALRVVDTTNPA